MDLTPEAIFMGALDPSVGEDIIEGRITAAQIGGEASRAGFTITRTEAENLRKAGLNQAQARQLYTAAQKIYQDSRSCSKDKNQVMML